MLPTASSNRPRRPDAWGLLLLGSWIMIAHGLSVLQGQPVEDKAPPAPLEGAATATSVREARDRARLLYETIDGALQVMHRDFFREDKSVSIPSRSLEDVFSELKERHGVELRWLAVNATAMSIDNNPRTDFEFAAVKALSAGRQEYEVIEPERYRFVGHIELSSQCLKCHLPTRTSTKSRAAGLSISMPLATERP